jgi:hypothetical protein
MLCRRAHDWISLSLDGMLPPDRTVALLAHLERCAGCRAWREEVQLGQRLLAATAPRLSDNFEWRLQLKLNQTLQEAARAATSPFAAPEPGWRRWFQGAALASVGGVAVVVAFSLFLLPPRRPAPTLLALPSAPASVVTPADGDSRVSAVTVGSETGTVTATAGDATRTSLRPGMRTLSPVAGGIGREVDLRFPATSGGLFGREGWSGGNVDDLRTIMHLREQNRRLRDALTQAQRDAGLLRAQMESPRTAAGDSAATLER